MGPDLWNLANFREATRSMIEHIAGHDRLSFEAGRKTKAAVLFEIVIQGECVKRLSTDFRARQPTVPWSQIAGMRDRIVHSFHEIDLNIVWEVANTIAPGLLAEVDRILAGDSKA